ncbi:unnamed protein product [Didymodactylos carnosus]|uniref:Uncharacterized protein n=1 Tax=Didymodactylos carnosus TaxID=1234261 RepID=A0A813PNF5_9BILA|nr:unnamed protein product [Didymodactylos carnosus]CAF1595831.1 unnamed protein product [Didymodactylos carnosus]CAF3538202.1 unnamed protein product [Didymodactylos carnosus]CAF4401978.1 unnamed protein product [Didymodactylos carnosus]
MTMSDLRDSPSATALAIILFGIIFCCIIACCSAYILSRKKHLRNQIRTISSMNRCISPPYASEPTHSEYPPPRYSLSTELNAIDSNTSTAVDISPPLYDTVVNLPT